MALDIHFLPVFGIFCSLIICPSARAMASVFLSNQVLSTRPVAVVDGQATSRYTCNQNSDLSVGSAQLFRHLQRDAHQPPRGAIGALQDDVIVLSSDDDSDRGNFEDSESVSSESVFPPIEAFLSHAECEAINARRNHGIGKSLTSLSSNGSFC